jgi:hypothetical protein
VISLNLHKSPSSKRAASRRRQFRLWSSYSYPQDSKTAGGNVPLQIPTFLKVGEGLKNGGRSGKR